MLHERRVRRSVILEGYLSERKKKKKRLLKLEKHLKIMKDGKGLLEKEI